MTDEPTARPATARAGRVGHAGARVLAAGLLTLLLTIAARAGAPPADAPPAGGPPTAAPGAADVLAGTMAEMTYPELERAARGGAVALWALGSIEEHGPHLPLATDVYVPTAQLRAVQQQLAGERVASVVVPPYFWGVNRVTGDFPGSLDIRAEVMVELMLDVFSSLARAGFRDVYCVTGHFDASHARAIAAAVRRAKAAGTIRAHFVVPAGLARRLELVGDDTSIVVADTPAAADASTAPVLPDLHAGADETSKMLALAPGLVRAALARTLAPTRLTPADVARWRQGGAHVRRITPAGYLGDPARAEASRGEATIEQESRAIAMAIRRVARAQAH